MKNKREKQSKANKANHNTGFKKVEVNETLRQEVISLYNNLFNRQIDLQEAEVSERVMVGIRWLYMDGGGSPLETAFYAEECMRKLSDENQKLEICRKLLSGETVEIPGMSFKYKIYGLFD